MKFLNKLQLLMLVSLLLGLQNLDAAKKRGAAVAAAMVDEGDALPAPSRASAVVTGSIGMPTERAASSVSEELNLCTHEMINSCDKAVEKVLVFGKLTKLTIHACQLEPFIDKVKTYNTSFMFDDLKELIVVNGAGIELSTDNFGLFLDRCPGVQHLKLIGFAQAKENELKFWFDNFVDLMAGGIGIGRVVQGSDGGGGTVADVSVPSAPLPTSSREDAAAHEDEELEAATEIDEMVGNLLGGVTHELIVDATKVVELVNTLEKLASEAHEVIRSGGLSPFSFPKLKKLTVLNGSQGVAEEEFAGKFINFLQRCVGLETLELENWKSGFSFIERVSLMNPEDRKFPALKALHFKGCQLSAEHVSQFAQIFPAAAWVM